MLMTEIVSFTPSSSRFRLAISRINYLHSRYGDRITNSQLIYVLGVFACNPWIWAEQWEWRGMTDLEIAASGTFLLGVGKMMHIDMSEIKGAGKGDPKYVGHALDSQPVEKETTSTPTEWADGLDWMIDMRAYMSTHEDQYLGQSQDTDALVEETLRMILDPFPRWMNGFMRQVASVMFEDRFRKSSE